MFRRIPFLFVVCTVSLSFAGKEQLFVEQGTALFRFPDCTSLKSKAKEELDINVLLNGNLCSKIQEITGRTSYVLNEDLKRHVRLEPENITGGLSSTGTITGGGQIEMYNNLELTRNFKDEIFESVDREELERTFDEN